MSTNMETTAMILDWKKSTIIPILKNGNTKNSSNYRKIAFISHTSKLMLKIIQGRLQPFVEQEIPDTQAGFRTRKGIEDQIANLRWTVEKFRAYKRALLVLHRLQQTFRLRGL